MLQYIIALITILAFGYFIFKKPTVETYVLFVAFALPFIDTKILPLAYGLVKVFDVLTAVALVLFFKDFISFKASSKGKIYVVLVVLFWILLVLSKMNSAYPFNNLHFIYQPFTIFIFARFLIIYLEQKPIALNKFISAFQLSVIILAAVVFIQLVVGTSFTYSTDLSTNIVNADSGLVRYPGLFQDSQICGQFLAMGSFSFLYFKPNIELKKKKRNLLFFGLTFAMLVFIAQPKEGVFSRTASISEDFLFRKSIWDETGDIIREYPLLGIGFANFQKYIIRYKQDLYLEKKGGGDFYYFNQPENGYLKVLVEQGYLGFFIFVALLLIPIINVILDARIIRADKRITYPIAAVLAWAVAFNSNYSLLDYRILLAVAIFVCLTIFSGENKHLFS